MEKANLDDLHQNTGERPLVLECCCPPPYSPPYSDDDTVLTGG